jgi:hypothetical protein
MSHLIIEQGGEVGKEITVPPSGIKFGRSPANDLVLEDEVLMLFQGRFFFKSDGTLWVTDFSVGEKSSIDGEPIDERQLKVGDLVEVGGTAFRIISTRQEQDEAPAPAEPDEEEIDLGFKPSRKPASQVGQGRAHEKQTSPMMRVLRVLVIVLVLLLVVVGATEIMRSRKSGGNGVHMEGIFFRYERVRGNADNIFRYALELMPNGVATLQVDDVHSRHFTRSAKVSDEDIQLLRRRVAESDFFKVVSDRVVKAKDRYDLCDIALECDGQFNHVRVLNRELPPDMQRMVDALEEFLFGSLDVSLTLLMDDTTLIQYAEDAFMLASDLYSERDTAHENLAQCIKHLQESINYLETINPKPEPYEKATKLLSKVRVEQDERYREYMFMADKAMRISDWEDARRSLRICAQIISNRSDERYDTIARKMLEVEDRLR